MSGRTYAYGEVTSYSPESRKPTVLSITQAVSLGFFFVTLIFFLLETQHVRFINVYVYTVTYGVVGAVLILILQPISFIGYMWRNRIRNPQKRMAAGDDHSFMGTHHTREIVIGLLSSIVGFLVIMWLLINWLNRFNKTCCTSADSDPETVVGGALLTPDELTMSLFMQWRVFYSAFAVSSWISLVCTVWMFRAVLAHFNPLRVITHIYNTTS